MLLFCLAYVLPGFLGRTPWKSADIASFGAMRELALTGSFWLDPQVLGTRVSLDGLVPYWLGAIGIKVLPFFDVALAARVPFGLLLALTLVATWYGVYHLARSPQAQPVAFAFGGEAGPVDYARAMADAGLLALIACLGLAQLSHETTPALAQLSFTALAFCAVAVSPWRSDRRLWRPSVALVVGLGGLALSGAPAVAVALGLGSAAVEWLDARRNADTPQTGTPGETWRWISIVLVVTLVVAVLAFFLNQWRWRVDLRSLGNLRSLGRLLFWFTWPAGPLALWTLYRWRRQLASRHVALPLWFAVVTIASTLLTGSSDRGLLSSLPALAALAAFALPTLRRSVASLIDWFTLLFFTGCAFIIWLIWIAMQTGIPRQPAANVAKLAPGFEPSFSLLAFAVAVLATLAWAWLVRWRAGRQRAAIWKSLVLPAGGTTLCWLLLMTLWLPLLDYARSYAPLAAQVARLVDRKACVQVYGLSSAQITALQYHAGLDLRHLETGVRCPVMLVDVDAEPNLGLAMDIRQWRRVAAVRRPTDKDEDLLVFRRRSETPAQGGAESSSAPGSAQTLGAARP